jgi:predicted regulator of Ras-like GTPase activity (Roadblock/LC7/MglB family)
VTEGVTVEHDDPTYAMMSAYLDVPGIMAAILVSDQGLVINSAQKEDVDTATVSALVVDIVAAAQRFGRESSSGTLDTLTIEFEGLSLLLAPFGQDCMLALVGHPGAFLQQSAPVGGQPTEVSTFPVA